MTTERSGDGGVAVRAMDLDPIRGGKLVIHVKRYRSTIPPAPVRDLYGTMLHEGATKGPHLVSDSGGECAVQRPWRKAVETIGYFRTVVPRGYAIHYAIPEPRWAGSGDQDDIRGRSAQRCLRREGKPGTSPDLSSPVTST